MSKITHFSCLEEEQQFRRLYGDPQGQIEIVAPGVEHAFFAPGDRGGARAALDLPDDVLRKVYYQNALRITQGIPQTGWPR